MRLLFVGHAVFQWNETWEERLVLVVSIRAPSPCWLLAAAQVRGMADALQLPTLAEGFEEIITIQNFRSNSCAFYFLAAHQENGPEMAVCMSGLEI